jgi:hypothetical protein
MIVYRDQRVRTDPRRLLARLRTSINRAIATDGSSQSAAEVLIQTGTLESAVVDAIFPDADGIDPVAESLRAASLTAGHALSCNWTGRSGEAKAWWVRLSLLLGHLEQQRLPISIETRIPEGFAYYGLYPEMYLDAARRCYQFLGQFKAVCLGLRSIGTSLSAVVAAVLEELGCQVRSFTLRPRGHPFSRYSALRPELEAALRAEPQAHFLVIDEGPGISGSSLGGTASMLEQLGIQDDHVILFPSHSADLSRLRSSTAREHWPRHRQFMTPFEELWLESGRLARELPAGQLKDYSGGQWRADLYRHPKRYPPAHTQHERRKFLLRPHRSDQAAAKLLSFVGLGDLAEPTLRRAERLAGAGYTPVPELVVHGFLVRPFIPGRPLSWDQVDTRLLEAIAGYLAHLSLHHAAEPSIPSALLGEMIRENVRQGLGEAWLLPLEGRIPTEEVAVRSVELDGRMQSHEWICTASGYLKVDAFDHYHDHFIPGCQDIAWDLAAASLELRLEPEARRHLVERYRSLSGDRSVESRLPFYALSYLSFRLGYSALAVDALAGTPDSSRFLEAAENYRRLLRSELSHEFEW